MIPYAKKTMLALSVLCLLAFPTAAQEVEGPPRLFSIAGVFELIAHQVQSLVADFGPEMEPSGVPTDDAQDETVAGDAGTSNEDDEGLPSIGPGLEPYG